jgi:hypothetical protein
MAKNVPAAQAAPNGEALPSSEKRSPDDWARELFPASDRGRPHPKLFEHGAAEALHGWKLHVHHAGAPLQLSRTDYVAALRAAKTVVGNTYAPHPAALSPHFPRS